MTIEELKKLVEAYELPESVVIVRCKEDKFIINQYVDYLKKKRTVEYISDYEQLLPMNDIFGPDVSDDSIRVLSVDEFNFDNKALKSAANCIIICNKISKPCTEMFSDNIVDVPKLEKWQIEDFAKTFAEGVDESDLQFLIELCNGNIYRLSSELSKLSIFAKGERRFLFKDFIDDNVFSDLSKYNIFNISNCIVKKDIPQLFNIYKDIKNIDVEPIGLLILLIQNFRDIIDVQLAVNPNPESLGMKPNKFWAVKYSCGKYTKDQLISIYSFLTDLDRKIKVGELPMEYLVDYIITKVLSC